jgi:hypothetical protein
MSPVKTDCAALPKITGLALTYTADHWASVDLSKSLKKSPQQPHPQTAPGRPRRLLDKGAHER